MRETRGFAIVKLSVTSTHMLTLYNVYLKRIRVVVRDAKAQHHSRNKKRKSVPIGESTSGMSAYQSSKHLVFR